ncbi:hypothetical protein M413DRAFT_437769 [Hebeloma cylindrosporum]|uniref:ubiquitinyl hydrolase 1 n=1 Tax=Hebeloma cylindrosporum TaxID=76867 RepID=A0A0C3CII9_HEBCY|nr:hypothetical protein M413DRAFT_437769 [Hebeloma cylindrosporum h7]
MRGGKGKERERERERDSGERDDESFLPTYVYDAMKVKKRFEHMRGGHQEDAEEFFGFYLDTLEEELLAMLASVSAPSTASSATPTNISASVQGKYGKFASSTTSADSDSVSVVSSHDDVGLDGDGWMEVGKRNRTVVTRTIKGTESPITRIFGGKFRSTLRAPGQKDSVLVEDWRALRLDIQHDQIHTIEDALSYISHPQTVQISLPTQSQSHAVASQQPAKVQPRQMSKYHQPQAAPQQSQPQTINAQQQVLIESLPPVLVLHIKRFCYDKESGGVVKVGKKVRFGGELDIGSDVMVPLAKKSQLPRYKLFGVLYHHGTSASGGHYTLDVLHPNRYPSSSSSASLPSSSSASGTTRPSASGTPSSTTIKPSSTKAREGWVRIDDDVVVDVRPEDVFGSSSSSVGGDETKCAYLLFYRRV